ncbi:sigma-70 family RNA polymerase sigma factor [Peterkaempfera griseoplana]|uniref:sigma-70 family RNA polymerase sigma factor n=1 Tax=Peterkaempfera griseoplana TaxID=66896 RepID=UPI0006E12885|nr:sigma-70 family RNA polymerase sigma factor [Peterkaempfera griseoplana]
MRSGLVLEPPGDARPAPGGPAQEVFLQELYQEHRPVVLRFAAGLCHGDWHRAEDILQEAALRAWKHAELFQPRATVGLRPWLFTVVRNLVIDQYRSLRARPAERVECSPPEPLVPDGTEQLITMRVVTEAMEDLTDHQREILLCLHYLGYTVHQAAGLLGVPPGTVKSRAFHAARALRRALRARGALDD